MSGPDLVATALANLGRRWGRTLLTVVGVAIGAAALVLLLSLAQGVRRSVVERFTAEEGMTFIMVVRSDQPIDLARLTEDIGIEDIRLLGRDELERIAQVPGVAYAAPFLQMTLLARGAAKRARARHVEGICEDDRAWLERFLAAGRFWSRPDAAEVVITSRFAERAGWSPPSAALGQEVVLAHPYLPVPIEARYRVVGVLDSDRMGLLRRHHVFLSEEPWWELERRMGGGLEVFLFRLDREELRVPFGFARCRSPGDVAAVGRRIREAGYQAITAMDAVAGAQRLFAILQGLLLVLGGVGLVVAVFGIANTMSMNVLERTREIGMMKAVGALDGTVLALFLTEAALVGLLGGMVGLGLGWAGGQLLEAAARTLRDVPPDVTLFLVPPWLAAASVGLTVAISMLAGLVPAWRAASMNPAGALRAE